MESGAGVKEEEGFGGTNIATSLDHYETDTVASAGDRVVFSTFDDCVTFLSALHSSTVRHSPSMAPVTVQA